MKWTKRRRRTMSSWSLWLSVSHGNDFDLDWMEDDEERL